jgi:asparagine synthase (glutamine-hydrolysing)
VRGDDLLRIQVDEATRLDTVSYYDDCEPNWDERPYFTRVEERRGRTGSHIDAGPKSFLSFETSPRNFLPTPAYVDRTPQLTRRWTKFLAEGGYRVILSGIGGDEVLGGVPTPVPELSDLLATGRWGTLAREIRLWALYLRKPWFHLLSETVRTFLPPVSVCASKNTRLPAWFRPDFVRRNWRVLGGYPGRNKLFCAQPSCQQNVRTLEGLRRQLACTATPPQPLYEKRYPYLDRDLLEFLFAIPPDQLVRPGERRSLMRRALRGIVPGEILNRKRKASVTRAPLRMVSDAWDRMLDLSTAMVTGSLGIVDSLAFREALEKARTGRSIPFVSMMRTLEVESWLRNVQAHRFLDLPPSRVNLRDHPIAETKCREFVL